MKKMKIISVVGARPNFVKIAPIISEFKKHEKIEHLLVHTGQHYDKNMSDVFFHQLGIPEPDINLGVGSGTHAEQTGRIMMEFENIIAKEKPDLVIVVGDVNSTIACSITAKKCGVKVAHIEAGLRSFDWTMPEEINRIVTDRISDMLFVTEKSGIENLRKEGVPEGKIFFVGNVMIDSLYQNLPKIRQSEAIKKFGLKPKEFCIATIHRPNNVDTKESLKEVMDIIEKVQEKLKFVLPLHPRTKKNAERFGLLDRLSKMKNLILLEPLPYLEFLNLVLNSKFVLTDSGGIQEETTFMQVPCITMRPNTERPVTIDEGTNILIGNDKERLFKEVDNIMLGKIKKGKIPELWDGKTSERIVDVILRCAE
jgi:UDP-N-acetylglucosamine 2-epimerase (non-hydrolysing)